MILSLLATLTPAVAAPAEAPRPAVRPAFTAQDDKEAMVAEYEKRYADAGDDVAKLLELGAWCKENKLRDQMRATYERVIVLDDANETAHKGLRHHFYDGQWFKTYAELSVYKRNETKMMEEKGLIKVGDKWVPKEDAPFMRMGWFKDESTGVWKSPGAMAKAEAEAKLAEEGYQQQYLVWVHPDEFEQWKAGLFKCGEEWLEKEKANEFHTEIAQWWEIPGDYFVLASTCDHDTVWSAKWQADQTYNDLVRIFGLQPASKPRVVLMSSLQQYNDYAAGNQEKNLPPSETTGASSCHFAYMAEIQFDRQTGDYDAGGVGFWDTGDDKFAPFGPLSARHAAALSFLQTVDPSWETVSKVVAGGAGQGQLPIDQFWTEKRIPRWMWYGSASYVERFYKDGASQDPWAVRRWAVLNLLEKGELSSFDTVFAMQLDPNDQAGASKLIGEAGLVMAFVMDGGCKPVTDAHAKLKAMLRRGEDTSEAVTELQKAIQDNKKAFDAFVSAAG